MSNAFYHIHVRNLKNGVYTAGRDESCDFVINGQYVSRVHAQIVKQNDDVFVVDNSTNGTTYKGHRLKKGMMAKINDGDEVFFANMPVIIGG